MKRNARFKLLPTLAAFVSVVLFVFVRGVAPVVAQSGGGYDLTWNKIAGGGATFSTGGGYELAGTIGQADAGTLNGGGYRLNGGFWSNTNTLVFVPLIIK